MREDEFFGITFGDNWVKFDESDPGDDGLCDVLEIFYGFFTTLIKNHILMEHMMECVIFYGTLLCQFTRIEAIFENLQNL